MKKLSKTYEQYCCVLDKNVVVEEITYHDGKKVLRCTKQFECQTCRNKILRDQFEKPEILKTDN